MTQFNKIEVREGRKNYYLYSLLGFVGIIAICFLIPSQRQETFDYFFGTWTFAKLPGFVILFGIMGYCIFYYFDNRVKIRIDEYGIWTQQYNDTSWNDIWYFSTSISKLKEGDLYYLKIRLKDTDALSDKEIKIRYRRMDKDFNEVRDIISFYAKKYNIQDLGHEKEV